MKSKRQKLFKEVPFDCWCEIIKFFRLPTDLLSLLLVVKGLDEYLKNRTANSTKNIEFYLHKIPKRTKNIVSQLRFYNSDPEDVGETILKKLGSSSLGIVFRRIFLRFPNLSYFDFAVCDFYSKNPENLKTNSCKSCGIFSSIDFKNIFSPCQYLKKLELTFCETKLNFDHLFPKLESIVLSRYGEIKRPVLGNENLFINWKKLPSLRTCHLVGWVVKTFSTENDNILRRLDELTLDSTDSVEISLERDEKEVIEDLKSIKNLIIQGLSLRHFRKISNLSTETLSISNGMYIISCLDEDAIHIDNIFNIVDMFCLTTLVIENDSMVWESRSEEMVIKNLPVLHKVNLNRLCFCVSFKEVPLLRYIETDNCYDFHDNAIKIDDINDAPLVEVFLVCDTPFSPELVEWVSVHKNLKRIILHGHFENADVNREISFSDFLFLESVFVNISVKSFSNCPKLKQVRFLKPSEGYTGFLTPINHLESFVVNSLGDTLSDTFFGQFLENVKMIDYVELGSLAKEKYNVFLDAHNVRNIRKLRLHNVNEFVINGDYSDEAAIYDLRVVDCGKVEISGLLRLKRVDIGLVESEVTIKNCKNLEIIRINGTRETENNDSKIEGLKLVLEDLIGLKSFLMKSALLREISTKNIGNGNNFSRNYTKDKSEKVTLRIKRM